MSVLFTQKPRWVKAPTLCYSLAVAFACVSGIASADSFTTRYGQSTCTDMIDTSDGRSVEFYGEVDTHSDEAVIGFKYVIEFQKKRAVRERCADANRMAIKHMMMDLERKELELELLRLRVEEAEKPPSARTDGDW